MLPTLDTTQIPVFGIPKTGGSEHETEGPDGEFAAVRFKDSGATLAQSQFRTGMSGRIRKISADPIEEVIDRK